MSNTDPYEIEDLALAMLKDRGIELDEPREIKHFFYCKDAETVNRLAEKITKLGLELGDCDFEDDEYIDEGGYALTGKETVKPSELEARREIFNVFAEQHGCDYDGWETEV